MITSKTGLASRRSELLTVNPASFNGQPTVSGSSIAGLKYKLPFNRTDITRSIEVIDNDRLRFIGNETVAAFSELANWYITLLTYDSEVLHHQIPLTSFVERVPRVVLPRRSTMRRFFAQKNLIDYHQSYIECSTDGLKSLVVIRPIYAV
jgi:hypothetical protein